MNHRTHTTSTARRRLFGITLAGLVALGATTTALAGDLAPRPPAPIGGGSDVLAPASARPEARRPAATRGLVTQRVHAHRCHRNGARHVGTHRLHDQRRRRHRPGLRSPAHVQERCLERSVHGRHHRPRERAHHQAGDGDEFNKYMLQPGTTYYFIVTVPTLPGQVPVQAVGTSRR